MGSKWSIGLNDDAISTRLATISVPQCALYTALFFSRSNGSVVRQQEHEHELDIVIAELCRDIEIAFFEPRLWGW